MTSSRFNSLFISVSKKRGGKMTVADVVKQAQTSAAHGRYREAARLLINSAIDLLKQNQIEAGRELLQDFTTTIQEPRRTNRIKAAYFLAAGQVASRSGQSQEARDFFERLRGLGLEVGNQLYVATALMYLATEADKTGHPDEARGLYLESLATLPSRHQTFVASITTNLAALALRARDIDEARSRLAIAEEALRSVRDPTVRHAFHLNMAHLLELQGQIQAARSHCLRALKAAERLGDQRVEMRTLKDLGLLTARLGDYIAALIWLRRAIALAEQLEDRNWLTNLHRDVAWVLFSSRAYAEAETELRRVADLATSTGDEAHWAWTIGELGGLALLADDTQRADSLLTAALDVFQKLKNRDGEARMLAHLVEVKRREGNPKSATEIGEQALQLLATSDTRAREDVLRRIALTWLATPGDRRRAAAYFRRGLAEYQTAAETSPNLAWNAFLYATALRETGLSVDALEFYDIALGSYERLQDQEMVFKVRNDRAIAYINLRNFAGAGGDLQASAALADTRHDRVMQLQVSNNLGEALRRQGRQKEAIDQFNKARELAVSLGDKAAEIGSLGNLAIALADEERLEDATQTFKLVGQLSRENHDLEGQAASLSGLAGLAFLRGDYRRAARNYQRAVQIYGRTSDRVHQVEELAALLQTEVARGDLEALQPTAQQLVTLAQTAGNSELASEALARTAARLLEREQPNAAASLFATSIVLQGVDASSGEEVLRAVNTALTRMIILTRQSQWKEESQFFNQVLSSMENQYPGVGPRIAPLLDQAASASI